MTFGRHLVHATIGLLLVMLLLTGSFFGIRISLEQYTNRIEVSEELVQGIFELSLLLDEYFMYGEERQAEQWNQRYASLSVLIEDARRRGSGKSIEEWSVLREYYEEIDELFLLVERYKHIPIVQERSVSDVSIRLKAMGDVAQYVLDQYHDDVSERHRVIDLLIILTFFVSTGAVIAAHRWLSVQMVEPVITLRACVEQVAKGNFAISIDSSLLKRSDELGDLARAFRKMTAELNHSYTSLEQAVAELRELDILKDEFLNIAAHELKTPLTSIRGLSELVLQSDDLGRAQRMHLLRIINQESSRLQRVVNQIVLVSQLEGSPKSDVDHSHVDLVQALESMKPLLDMLCDDYNSSIRMTLPHEPVVVDANEDRIREVLYNLVDNACKYGDQSRPVEMRMTRHAGTFAQVKVINSGEQIPEQDKKRLFQKFSQLEPSMSRKRDGVGLGLYICKLIVEKWGGDIGVSSLDRDDVCFYFSIPLAQK